MAAAEDKIAAWTAQSRVRLIWIKTSLLRRAPPPVGRQTGAGPPASANMNETPDPTQAKAASLPQPRRGSPPAPGGFDWMRFWVRSLMAVLLFNAVAAFVTWYWIFPRLHPAH
jgi:hypothetical protein